MQWCGSMLLLGLWIRRDRWRGRRSGVISAIADFNLDFKPLQACPQSLGGSISVGCWAVPHPIIQHPAGSLPWHPYAAVEFDLIGSTYIA